MKHNLSVPLILLITFLLAQFIGLFVLYNYIDPVKSEELGKTSFKELPVGERPQIEEKTSFVPVIISILIGTGVLLLLIKYSLDWIWKLWFLIALTISLTMVFGVFVPWQIAFGLALVLGIWKIWKPNFWIQNITELLVYGGLAAIFVPLFNLLSMSILLIFIVGYDAYAVWKSKHMVTLAQSQIKSKVFSGLLIPYKMGKMAGSKMKSAKNSVTASKSASSVPVKVRTAILGGGDIGFPLLFAGVIMKEIGLWQSLLIPFFALGGLAFLLWYGDEKKFYPAMPFISAGCFVGLGVVGVVSLLV